MSDLVWVESWLAHLESFCTLTRVSVVRDGVFIHHRMCMYVTVCVCVYIVYVYVCACVGVLRGRDGDVCGFVQRRQAGGIAG